ncbi:hypothetical protein [Cystobacter fuscus]|uniref:hypothetical protein n=1 Tax=Cystobacter fuscus TaxID=43 RepID=UPI002B27E401|nr:hypothetical protein F0U63_30905 [Cystobacter fuscus]
MSLRKVEGPSLSSSTPSSPGDWTESDRVNRTQRWQDACLYNLKANNFRRYTRIIERRDFYLWFYKYSVDQGCEARWALAASIVATGAHEVAIMNAAIEDLGHMAGTVGNELQGMMREGNQVIFDNVFPKLHELVARQLQGRPAFEWDMRTLSEEQTLIQPLYDGVSQATRTQLNRIARLQGLPGAVAHVSPGAEVKEELPYVRGGRVPAFTGTALTSIDDRWHYGMTLGNLFTPGGTGYNPAVDKRPTVSAGYKSGTELSRVRTRPNLHRLDAALDGGGVGARWLGEQVDALLRRLTTAEQAELLRDRRPDGDRYSVRCRLGSRSVVFSLLSTWRISLEAQMRFLSGYIGGENNGPWIGLRYSELAPIIRPFSQAEKNRLHTPEWQRIFTLVCDDDTILEAVRDLGLPEPLRTQWVTKERSWF